METLNEHLMKRITDIGTTIEVDSWEDAAVAVLVRDNKDGSSYRSVWINNELVNRYKNQLERISVIRGPIRKVFKGHNTVHLSYNKTKDGRYETVGVGSTVIRTSETEYKLQKMLFPQSELHYFKDISWYELEKIALLTN